MGCVSSKKGSVDITSDSGSGTGRASRLSRERYYAAHPGSHNKPKDGPVPPPLPKPESKFFLMISVIYNMFILLGILDFFPML